MMNRVLPLVLMAVALALFVGAPALAQQQKDAPAGDTHTGKIVSATATKFVMTDEKTGKEHSHSLAQTGTVSIDGRNAKLEDLKPGMRIRVTTQKGNLAVATKVEALDKLKDFSPPKP
jgi:hypothetical protein